ncbi:hypothetical protein AHF37_04418 [Paragonimus kellicotti]|nr:hypothetical protein AHF37_04418 [Paragonimus kellicotti]
MELLINLTLLLSATVEELGMYLPSYMAAACILYALNLTVHPDLSDVALRSVTRIQQLLRLEAKRTQISPKAHYFVSLFILRVLVVRTQTSTSNVVKPEQTSWTLCVNWSLPPSRQNVKIFPQSDLWIPYLSNEEPMVRNKCIPLGNYKSDFSDAEIVARGVLCCVSLVQETDDGQRAFM